MVSLKSKPEILVIDDDARIGELFEDLGEACGCGVTFVSDYASFTKALSDKDFNAIFVDLIMPTTDGIEYLKALSDYNCQAKITLMSGYDTTIVKLVHDFGKVHGLKMSPILEKPFPSQKLKTILNTLDDLS